MKTLHAFSGIDHVPAVANTGICLVLGVIAYLSAPPTMSLSMLTILAIAVLLAMGTRYELRISTKGIVWTGLVAWVLPVRRLRYLLDAEIDIYQSFEADRPEGVCVRPLNVSGRERESPCFGPSFSQSAISSLWERANEAICETRKRLPALSQDLRCQLLAKDAGMVHVHQRNWQGRAREAELVDDIRIGDLLLPAGTALEFGCDGYLDPRREDVLVAAIAKTTLRIPAGIEVPPGTRMSMAPSGEVRSLHGVLGLLNLDGFPVDGNDVIGLDAKGHIEFFTLGSELEMADRPVLAGTTFSTWPKLFGQGPTWYCTLRGTLHLPELDLGPGDSAIFDKGTRKLIQIYPHKEHRIDGMVLRSGPISVLADGRIDRERARRDGLLGQ